MRVALFPHHALAPVKASSNPSVEDAALYATLLYADTITLTGLGPSDTVAFPSDTAMRREIDGLVSLYGRGPMDVLDEKFTWHQAAALSYAIYHDRQVDFRKTWQPLLKESVVEIWDLSRVAPLMQQIAEKDGIPGAEAYGLAGILKVFVDSMPRMLRWLDDSRIADAVGDAASRYDGLGIASVYLRGLLEKLDSADLNMFMEGRDRASKRVLFSLAYLLGTFLQAFTSETVHSSVLCFSQHDLSLRSRFLSFFGRQMTAERNPLQLELLSETAVQIPEILPRSPQSVLMIRSSLSAELAAFRRAVDESTEDLLSEEPTTSKQAIARQVRERFKRPLEDLIRRLAHPNRELTRNILGKDALVTGGLSLMSALSAGGPALFSAMLGVAVPVLVGSLQTRFQRQREMERAPEIAFLLHASARHY